MLVGSLCQTRGGEISLVAPRTIEIKNIWWRVNTIVMALSSPKRKTGFYLLIRTSVPCECNTCVKSKLLPYYLGRGNQVFSYGSNVTHVNVNDWNGNNACFLFFLFFFFFFLFSYSLNVQRARQRANADDGLTRELVMKRTDEDNWDTIERMQENTHITSVLESLGL